MRAPIGLSYVADLIEAGVVEPPNGTRPEAAVDLLRLLPDVPIAPLVAGSGASSPAERAAARAALLAGAGVEADGEEAYRLDVLLALPDVVALASLRPLDAHPAAASEGGGWERLDDDDEGEAAGKEDDDDDEDEDDDEEEGEEDEDEDDDNDEDDDEYDGDDDNERYRWGAVHSKLDELDEGIARLSSAVSSGFIVVGVLGAVSTVGILLAVAGAWAAGRA